MAPTCGSCGRTVDAGELIAVGDRLLCGPCQEEAAKAEERRDSIDAAWSALEASVPKGWRLVDLTLEWQPEWPQTIAAATASAAIGRTVDERYEENNAQAKATTPAGALRLLAVKLSEGT